MSDRFLFCFVLPVAALSTCALAVVLVVVAVRSTTPADPPAPSVSMARIEWRRWSAGWGRETRVTPGTVEAVTHLPAHWVETRRTVVYTEYAAGDTVIRVAYAVRGEDGVWRGSNARQGQDWIGAAIMELNNDLSLTLFFGRDPLRPVD